MSDLPAIQPSAPVAASSGGIGLDTSRLSSRANLEKAGKQFEAVFVGMMLKSMRQASLASPLFDSKALDTFRDMQDQKTAQAMADHAPLGIGKAMVDFLAKAQAASAAPATSEGAIDPGATR